MILNFALFKYLSLVQFPQVFPPSKWSLYYLFFHCCIVYALVCFQDLLLHHSWHFSHFMTVITHNRPIISQSYAEQPINNQRQNEVQHFALNSVFYLLLTSKGGNIAFPPPSNVVPLFELPTENNKLHELWMEATGEGCGFFCSLKLPYLNTMSQQFCHQL